jgi:hypothetical protein
MMARGRARDDRDDYDDDERGPGNGEVYILRGDAMERFIDSMFGDDDQGDDDDYDDRPPRRGRRDRDDDRRDPPPRSGHRFFR